MGGSRETKKQPDSILMDLTESIVTIFGLGLHVGPYGNETWYAASSHDWNCEGVIVEIAESLPLAVARAASRIAAVVRPNR